MEFYFIEGKGWGGEGREGGWRRSQWHGESVSNVNGRQMYCGGSGGGLGFYSIF